MQLLPTFTESGGHLSVPAVTGTAATTQTAVQQLDTLDSLYDFYFVQPADLEAKRAALDQKLADAGKPRLK